MKRIISCAIAFSVGISVTGTITSLPAEAQNRGTVAPVAFCSNGGDYWGHVAANVVTCGEGSVMTRSGRREPRTVQIEVYASATSYTRADMPLVTISATDAEDGYVLTFWESQIVSGGERSRMLTQHISTVEILSLGEKQLSTDYSAMLQILKSQSPQWFTPREPV